MARLSLTFLGSFQATLEGRPLTGFESNKVRALLVYLAVEGAAGRSVDRPHPRDVLAGLLWPDWPQSAARKNLRHALANLRQVLGDAAADPPFLLITREAMQFNTQSDYTLDVATFLDLVAAAPHDASAPESLQAAVEVYRGSFLEGFSVADSAPFEGWAALQREHLGQQMLDTLQRLTMWHEQHGAYGSMLAGARRQVELEPTSEEAQRQLMRALALNGRRSAALAQFEACRRVLGRELGVEPTLETTALYESVRQGRFGIAARASSAAAAPTPGMALTAEPDEGPEPPPPLFVAREQELAQLDTWLGESLAGKGRVGFVVGESGSGKTVLAREFARRAMEQHRDLVVAWGNGNAYSGMGDPYLPFSEVLAMLTADIEEERAAGSLSREHARRLSALFPAAIGALLDGALGLVGPLLPREALLARAQALAARSPDGPVLRSSDTNKELGSGPADAPQRGGGAPPVWTRMEGTLQRRAALAAAAPVSQTDLFQQVTRFLQALARQQPLLLVLDDLQWVDAASIALLFHLTRHLAGSRILVLGLYRPEEVEQGRNGQRHPLEPVALECARLWPESRLDLAEAEGQRFVTQLVDSEPNRLGRAFRERLYRHTGGHALFTTELLRGLRERGDPSGLEPSGRSSSGLEPALLPQRPGRSPAGSNSGRGLRRDAEGYWVEASELDWERLPRRLEAVIAAHLGRLPTAWQEWLTVASVEGEEFTAEVVARVVGVEEGDVLRTLRGPLSVPQRLVRAISLQRRGEQRLSRYRFRHALFQQYLYGRLDEVERSRLHEEVGRALEALYGVAPHSYDLERSALAELIGEGEPDQIAFSGEQSVPSPGSPGASPFQAALVPQLARHFRIAGLTQKALAYLSEAGEMAYWRVAPEEAAASFHVQIGLLRTLPQTLQRLRYERKAQRYHGAAWLLESALLPEVHEAMQRALELARRIGPAEESVSLMDLAWVSTHRGDLRLAGECCERAVALAQDLPPPFVMAALARRGQVQFYRGDFVSACRDQEPLITPCLGTDPSVVRCLFNAHIQSLGQAARTLWCLGYPDRALRVACAGLQMGYASEAILRIRQAVSGTAIGIHLLRGEVCAVRRAADELAAVVGEGRDIAARVVVGPLYRGWVQVHAGAVEAGIASLRQGLATWDAGFGVQRAYWRGYLAEALGLAGRGAEGLVVLDEALAEVERTGDRSSLAETHRLRGELLLQRGVPRAAAEACFQTAIEVARGQEAKSWELRATVSLARLWGAQGKGAEARERLAGIYGWFTEGFDTRDLVEAKALLEELAPQGR